MFDKFKQGRKIDDLTADALGKAIEEKAKDPNADPKEIFELWQNRKTVKSGGITVDTWAKIAGNVVVMVAIMAFETRYLINRNASKFIQPLK